MPINPDETELVGEWKLVDGRMVGNEAEDRIERLVRGELKRIAAAGGGWEVLFQDPRDGRHWELTYPHGEMHGGGPRYLRVILKEEAFRKYGMLA